MHTDMVATGWAPGSLIDGRFRVEEVLRTGPSSRTLGAVATATGQQVVITTIDDARLTPVARALFEHEVQVVMALDSPSIVPILADGRHRDHTYLVSPRLEGLTLDRRLLFGPLSTADAVAVALDVATGLRLLHGRGVLHRSIKPSNIMVRGEGVEVVQATVLDAASPWSAEIGVGTDLTPGAVAHLSPEAAGLTDAPVDERSDLYAFGLVLFEALSGRAVHEGATSSEVLRSHLSAPVPSLRDLRIAVPSVLDDVVARLLAKDPTGRYQSADAVIEDLQRIAAQLDAGVTDPALVIGASDRRTSLAEPTFIGRAEEMACLDAQLSAVRDGGSSTVTLEAPSGGGKTRLLSEFARVAMLQGAWLLRGQGVDQAAPHPFRLLEGVADGLLEASRQGRVELVEQVKQAVGDQAQAVVDALPVLGELFGFQASTLGPEAHGEARSIRALCSLLDALGGHGHPVVVLLDDCQWADELTVKVLREWANRADVNAKGLMVVTAFRSEEVAARHPLRVRRSDLHLELDLLDRAHISALVESMGGRMPEAVVQTVVRLSDGSPFMAAAVLRGMVESGALRGDASGWTVDALRIDELHSSTRAASVLAKRLDLLGRGAHDVLQVGAVLGKSFDVQLVADLMGRTLPDILAQLEEPRRRHMLWIERSTGVVSFTHDKLRESMLDGMPRRERQLMHRRAAEHLERKDGSRVFELAYHFDAAEMPGRALPYALRAAALARSRHSLKVAEEQYRIARRGVAPEDADANRDIAVGLGTVAMLRGEYATAEAEFGRAKSMATEPVHRAEIGGSLGELAFKRGDSVTAAAQVESALRSLGRRVPHTFVGHLVAGLWQALVQVVHTLLSGLVVARRSLDDPRLDEDRLAVRLHSQLAHAYWFSRGSIPTAWTHLRGMNIAERYPATPELAATYSDHAPFMTLLTWFDRGLRYVERSLELRTAMGDVWGQGQSMHFRGVVLYGASRYEECEATCREAVRILERTGDQWEINTARWHMAYCAYRLGDVETAVSIAREVHHSGVVIGDAQARGIGLAAWSKASGGDVPEELLAPEVESVDRDVHTGAEILQAEAIRLIARGDVDEAVVVLRRARKMIARTLAMQEYVAPVFAWLATALRTAAESVPAFQPGQRRKAIRRAGRAAFWACFVSALYRNNQPHALRESGIVHALRGRDQRAERAFTRSCSVARSQGAEREVLLTLESRIRVGGQRSWALDDTRVEVAALKRRLGQHVRGEGDVTRVTASLVDRFEQVLTVGRQIAVSLSFDEVHDAVRDGALRLLRGDDCQVVEVHGGAAPSDLEVISDDALRRGMAQNRPILFGGPGADAQGEEADVRSGICMPIQANGQVAMCVLVWSTNVAGLYGADDMQLAEFISAIAGAALENTSGFEQVQRMSASLESEVATRTLELQEAVAAERRARSESDGRAELLHQLAAAGRRMSTLDPASVLDVVVQTSREMGFDAAEIVVISDDRKTYRVERHLGLPASYAARTDHPTDHGIVGRALASGRTVVIDDYRDLPDALDDIVADGLQSSIAVPILSEGRCVGVMVAGNRSARSLGQDEIEVFDLLATQAGRALENARAYAAQAEVVDRLAELDRLKDTFLASASHELRTPLAVIRGMGMTLEGHWDTLRHEDVARTFLGRINANSAVLTEIITNLLDFAQASEGSLEAEVVPMDLTEFSTAIADRLEPILDEHCFEVDVAPGLVVEGDHVLLGRAVENLLTNACRYTPEGSRVQLSVQAAGSGMVEVVVQDNGPGVAPDEIDRLTDRFFRGADATLSSRRGLGLGLAFTADVLALHGTTLRVENVPGSGARFSFRLERCSRDGGVAVGPTDRRLPGG